MSRAIGYKTAPENIPALKYGREMEGVARRAYKVALESIGHVNVSVEETGGCMCTLIRIFRCKTGFDCHYVSGDY